MEKLRQVIKARETGFGNNEIEGDYVGFSAR
jgi:hypothetical protein